MLQCNSLEFGLFSMSVLAICVSAVHTLLRLYCLLSVLSISCKMKLNKLFFPPGNYYYETLDMQYSSSF